MNQILICMYDLDSVNMLVYFVVRNFFVTLKCINIARSIKAVNFDLYIHGSNMQKNGIQASRCFFIRPLDHQAYHFFN